MSYKVNLTSGFYSKKVQRYNTTERQDLTTTFSEALGSSITYHHFYMAEKVLYEYITSWTFKDTASKINFRLLEYNTGTSSWDVISGAYMTIKTLKSGSNQICVKFLLNGWTGSKQLKVECKEDSNSLEGYLHSNLDNTKFFDPIVSCTGIK
tara:strand:- start:807 stop:1262 length:456 start_codon:yes stop_codon:yes gene_type:complete